MTTRLRWILVPGVITLAVTALRLSGELLELPPVLFGPKGGGALLGITWLIPVFGVWFALRLLRAGDSPPRPVGALATMLLGAGCVGLASAVARLWMGPTPWSMALAGAACVLGGVCALHAWPELGRLLLAYAIAARAPVMAVACADAWLGLGTHYGQLAPGAADPGPLARALVLCLAQVVFWMPLTMLGGGLAGMAALAFGRRRRPAPDPARNPHGSGG